jgi:hypothetical protein
MRAFIARAAPDENIVEKPPAFVRSLGLGGVQGLLGVGDNFVGIGPSALVRLMALSC